MNQKVEDTFYPHYSGLKQYIACTNMVQGQIKPSGVSDQLLLDLMCKTPRSLFVPSLYRNFAFADIKLPLPNNESLFTPREEAQIMQRLAPQSSDTVLEVGTGSGYLTALIAQCVHHVYSVDINPQVTQQVAKSLAELKINNVTLVTGNAIQGWHAQSDYDMIWVNGSIPFVPKALCQNLALGGRLFAIVGHAPVMNALWIKRLGESDWHLEVVFNTNQARIANPLPDASFIF